MKSHLKWVLLPIIGLLASCAIYAPDERTELNNDLPEQFTLYSEKKSDAENRWWESKKKKS